MKKFWRQIPAMEWLMIALIFYASLLLPLLVVQGTSGLASYRIATESSSTRTFVDDLGSLVAINGTPQRIISLAPSNTEILFALGLGDKIIAITLRKL
jgi:iron complex transport system substrate-binding protein